MIKSQKLEAQILLASLNSTTSTSAFIIRKHVSDLSSRPPQRSQSYIAMSRPSAPMDRCPIEIWQEIFAIACTDTGLTGRSLSLVSKRFHDISVPLKYQSIAITRWRQLFAFSQIFSQLPDLQKKIKYLFVHCPYPFLDVEDDPWLADPIAHEEDSDFEDSETDYSTSESDSDLEFVVSLGFDGKLKVLDCITPEGNTRDSHSEVLDYKIQAVFDKATHALDAILNETSSTLNILTLYWTSFRPLQIHAIIPGPALPFLDELHLYRCSVVEESIQDDLPTITLFPRLRMLVVSGDFLGGPLERDIAIIAPNLTHLRLSHDKYNNDMYKRIQEDVIFKMSTKCPTNGQVTEYSRGGSNFDRSKCSVPVMQNIGVLPENWQILWSSRVAGVPDLWSVLQDS